MSSAVTERFHATTGQFSGYVGLAVTLGILVLAVLPWDAGRPLGVAILALLGTVLVWAAMLRPALWVTERTLVMRGIFHTDVVPLGLIDRVVVSQLLAISVGGRRYTSPIVGYTARQKVKAKRRSFKPDAPTPTAADTYQVYVEERIAQLAREDRERFGRPESAAVRRTWAWPEIVACVVLLAAWLVWLLVL